MGHAAHFLERLDRLSAQHTEEALLLYNDPELLRTVLTMARVPERVERVALALGDDGPYVLVTREGRFVTCLGAGMTLGDTLVVRRKQLDDFTGKVGELRGRFELARSLVGTEKTGAAKLVGRLASAGADLSREEFTALVLLQPLLVKEFLRSLFGAVDHLRRVRDGFPTLKLGKQNRQLERVLHEYWNAYWASGHLSLLLATNGSALFDAMPDDMAEPCRSIFAWGTVRQGGVGLTLRGSWAVGRFGKTMMPAAKQRVREAQSPTQYLTGALSLVSLAARHTGLRAEALKELAGSPPDTAFEGAPLLKQTVYATASRTFEKPDGAADVARLYAEASLDTRRDVRRLPPVPLPDERILPTVGLDLSNFHLDETAAQCLFVLLPQVARASAEDFYLPRADLDTFGYGPWIPGYSRALLEPLIERPAAPAKAPVTVGRNDPCACGSGKKSKRCCAA